MTIQKNTPRGGGSGVILSAGPGAHEQWLRHLSLVGAPQVLICVNKAREIVKCHEWWCSGDACRPGAEESMPDKRTLRGVCSVRTPPVEHPECFRLTWAPWSVLRVEPTNYSICAALYLAWFLRLERVTVLGHGMTGTRYCDGTTADTLNPERWAHERTCFQAALMDIAARGVSILWDRQSPPVE